MNTNIKATYDGKYFELIAEECNTVELLSFVCDVLRVLAIFLGTFTVSLVSFVIADMRK